MSQDQLLGGGKTRLNDVNTYDDLKKAIMGILEREMSHRLKGYLVA